MAKIKSTRWVLRYVPSGGYQVVKVSTDFDEENDLYDPDVNSQPIIDSFDEANALLTARQAPPQPAEDDDPDEPSN